MSEEIPTPTDAAPTPEGVTLPPADAPARIVDKKSDNPSSLGEAFHNTGKAGGAVVMGTFDMTGKILSGIGKGVVTIVNPETYKKKGGEAAAAGTEAATTEAAAATTEVKDAVNES